MTPRIDLGELARRESEQTEWKENVGYVVCGAMEAKDTHGEVRNTVLARCCRDRISSPIAPLVEELESEDPQRRILVLLQPATESAHTFRRRKEGSKHFVSGGRSTIEVRNGLLEELLVRKASAKTKSKPRRTSCESPEKTKGTRRG